MLCHKQHTNLSRPDLKESHCKVSWERAIKQKREREREVRYLTDGTRMPASLPGSWHQAWAPSAHSNCLHFQIYDCMINEDFILPSATLQSAFPVSDEAAMTQGDWFLISIWCHYAESTFLWWLSNDTSQSWPGFDRFYHLTTIYIQAHMCKCHKVVLAAAIKECGHMLLSEQFLSRVVLNCTEFVEI